MDQEADRLREVTPETPVAGETSPGHCSVCNGEIPEDLTRRLNAMTKICSRDCLSLWLKDHPGKHPIIRFIYSEGREETTREHIRTIMVHNKDGELVPKKVYREIARSADMAIGIK